LILRQSEGRKNLSIKVAICSEFKVVYSQLQLI
jgi:hypothetical protein